MKLKGKWIVYGSGLTVSGDQLTIDLGSGLTFDGNRIAVDDTVVRTDTYQVITGKKIFTVFPEIAGTPPTDNAIVNKAYVDSRLRGLHWRPPIYTANQLASAPVGGIRPCIRLAVVNPSEFTAGESIYVRFNDGTVRTFSLSIVDTGSPGPGEIDVSDSPDANTIANRILTAIQTLADSGNTAAAFFSLNSNVWESRVNFVYHSPLKLIDFAVWVSAGLELGVHIDGPENDNIGRSQAELVENETHFVMDEDVAYTWNFELDQWIPVTGSGTVPLATKDTAGKVRPQDGIGVNAGDIYIDLAPVSGLELVGTSPYKQLTISDSIAGSGLTIVDKVLHVDIVSGGGLGFDGNQLKVETTDIVDPNKAIEVVTNRLGVKVKPGGGISIDPIEGLYVDLDFGEQFTQELIVVTSDHFVQGYFELSAVPTAPNKVRIFAVNGPQQLNKAVVSTFDTPDFEVCTEPGYENRIYFRNGFSVGTFTSSGLSEHIQVGDKLIVMYEV